jgi:putative transposase
MPNAPRVFQKAMQNIFREVEYVKVFLDDIFIHSPNEEQHSIHVQNVLKILNNQNASINFEKSSFCQKSVKYLGSVINEHGITRHQTNY